MRYLLNLVYLALLALAAPWLIYSAVRTGKYRQGWAAKFWGRVPLRTGERRCVWLHAVSVGEVNLLKPLLTALEHDYPDVECVISTTTRAGFDLARQKYAPRTVFYCPLDFSWAVSRALRRIRPDLLVLAELELWPNLLAAAKRRGTRVAVVNGRLSEKSWRGYQRIVRWVRGWLQHIDVVGVQNTTYADRFRSLGLPRERIAVTGSVKFDGAQSDRDNPSTRRLAELAGITAADRVFLAGSTQSPEEATALEAFQRVSVDHPELRLVIVPRHPERFDEVARLLDRAGVAWDRRSCLKPPAAGFESGTDEKRRPVAQRILLVDTVGELGAWWGTAQFAFVGGSLGNRGGQNMIEPAAYGAALSFGPNTQNFRDVVAMLLAEKAASVVRNGMDLEAWLRQMLEDPEFAAAQGERARSLVLAQQGATRRTLDLLRPLLDPPRPGAEGGTQRRDGRAA
ncbi:MAG: 3-deoxy-D-manno-octulosonic acid transferase [Pirellulales bacterium]